eukprot:CAMPEP_0116826566 /NCGR_PEP_ID=MMETSP0418-20121206/2599_1 /TAXON_ID=1158023 /ORGANISM="Astrosyne radiata, Strain 13vi08-1A" /LENGTH=297 /DNA_ID=CAMNT_0004455213 /DNA_START=72 /DNA_END=965 /DNA_ORIENTATION=+
MANGESSMKTHQQHSTLVSSPSEILGNLPSLEGGLASIDRARLRQYVQPIWNALAALDAEALLSLQRTEDDGAEVNGSALVHPIHDQVLPPKPEFRDGSCVRYLHVSEVADKYSIGIFVFPPNATIPLHDHPGMCVLSRVLYGSVERLSLDLERPPDPHHPPFQQHSSSLSFLRMFGMGGGSGGGGNSSSNTRPPNGGVKAYRRGVDQLTAPAVTMLYPYEGNLHEFRAGPHGAAVLDVLLPPYDTENNRDCTFYYIHDDDPNVGGGETGACWIVPTGQPENFHCLSGRYRDLGDEF